MSDHPITPPPELVQKWDNDWHRAKIKHTTLSAYVATQAARWGWNQCMKLDHAWLEAKMQEAKDEELEACADVIYKHEGEPLCGGTAEWLRAARRPKPPSLKEQSLKHLEVMERDGHYLPEIISDLRRAVESLPD